MLSTLFYAHFVVSRFSVAVPIIPTVTLNNGVELPMMSLGTCTEAGCLNDPDHANQTEETDKVLMALKVGYTAVDTAAAYGTENGVGVALEGVRSSVFVTTKIGKTMADAPAGAYNVSMYDLNRNLERLNTDYVDLVLLHYPVSIFRKYTTWSKDDACFYMQEQWRALEDFTSSGKARAIGVSNFCQSDLACILETATIVPAVNELRLHVGMGPDPRGLLSYTNALDLGIKHMAYYPLTAPDFYTGDKSGARDLRLVTGDFTKNIGKRYNKTGAQAALRWLVQHGISPISSSHSEKHLRQNLEIFDFTLDDADMQQLDAATMPLGEPNGWFPDSPLCGDGPVATV